MTDENDFVLPDLSDIDFGTLAFNDPVVEEPVGEEKKERYCQNMFCGVSMIEHIMTPECPEWDDEPPVPFPAPLIPPLLPEPPASEPVVVTSEAELLQIQLKKLLEDHEQSLTEIALHQEHIVKCDLQVQEYYRLIDKKQFEKKATQTKLNDTDKLGRHLKEQIATLQQKIKDIEGSISADKILAGIKAKIDEHHSEAPWYKAAKMWQMEDIVFMTAAFLSGQNGALNANIMGSGKTLEEAAFIDILSVWAFKERFNFDPKIIWITKKAGMYSSQKELGRWNMNNRFAALPRNTSAEMREMTFSMIVQLGGIPVVNYDMIKTTPFLQQVKWDVIIIDEVHHLKGGANASGPTQRFKVIRDLLGIRQHSIYADEWVRSRETQTISGETTQQLPFLSLLSGTPVQNKPEEVWCYLHLFDPATFGSLSKFKSLFVNSWEGFKPMKVLALLQGRFIRQDPDLIRASRPSKDQIIVEVDMTDNQRAGYEKIKEELLLELDAEYGDDEAIPITSILAKFTRLRQYNVWPHGITVEGEKVALKESGKFDAALELMQGFSNEGEQAVIFSNFKQPLYDLADFVVELGLCEAYEVGFINGDVKDADLVEENFQQGRIKYLFCVIKAAGEMFNFQKNPEKWPGGAHHAIFLDLWWNPSVNEQAEDRIWREGAIHGVSIWILHGVSSIDNLIQAICEDKSKMFSDLIEQKSLSPSKTNWMKMFKELI